MFQIKPILILHKDNQSKHKMQFLRDYFIYEGGKAIGTFKALWEQVIAP